MNIVYIHQFQIEKTYHDLVIYLFLGFVIMSFLTLFAVVSYWEISGIYLVLSYIIGGAMIAIVIIAIEIDLMKKLEIKFVTVREVSRPKVPGFIFSFWYLVIYSAICPFCRTYMEINHTNMGGVPKYSNQYPICIHYRGLKAYPNERYVKFVNPKNFLE